MICHDWVVGQFEKRFPTEGADMVRCRDAEKGKNETSEPNKSTTQGQEGRSRFRGREGDGRKR
jgi:hypothetical protein